MIGGSVLWLALSLALGAARADSLVIESPATRVALLELYTSEGCSSCPPADRWLSSLVNDPRLWRQVVPVAFHVDYWDSLGWSDRFADPAYSQRQRTLAREGHIRTVYTPGLVLNGKEWRSWFRRPLLQLAEATSVGKLRLTVEGPRVSAGFAPTKPVTAPLVLNLAVLGFGLESQIDAGENRGRRLRHDFVVLDHRLSTMQQSRYAAWRTHLIVPAFANIERQALVAWVVEANTTAPLQAVGGWLSNTARTAAW